MINSAEEFVQLRTSDNPLEYRRAAHEEAAVAVWMDVICRYPEMKAWVIHNKTVPLEILRVLANDSDPDVRSAIAIKRKLNRELFEQLSHDPDVNVRASLAWNAKIPVDILRNLAADPNDWVAENAQRLLASHQE